MAVWGPYEPSGRVTVVARLDPVNLIEADGHGPATAQEREMKVAPSVVWKQGDCKMVQGWACQM